MIQCLIGNLVIYMIDFKKVKTFCEKNEIEVPDMDEEINIRGTSRRRKQKVTNMHYYHVEIFLVAIDAILT